MAQIGTFTEKNGNLVGKIHTLTIDAAVSFLPNTNQTSPDAPAYRVFTGKSEIGAAWEKTSEATGVIYHSVRLDDPTFAAPIFANLFQQDDGSYSLVWSRPKASR